MTEEGKKYLSDVSMAIDLIETFISDTVDYAAFENDLKTQSAVERQLIIVGEAINKFRKTAPDISIKNDKQIVAFRNRIVHAYDSIDNSIVWAILKKHLPKLKKEIQELSENY